MIKLIDSWEKFPAKDILSEFFFFCFTCSGCLHCRTLPKCRIHRGKRQWLKAELRKLSSTQTKMKQTDMRQTQRTRYKDFRAVITGISWKIYCTPFLSYCFLFWFSPGDWKRSGIYIHWKCVPKVSSYHSIKDFLLSSEMIAVF